MGVTFPLTDEQLAAATTIGKSLIVSAAAGSGKTTVLAQRCAYLVCDAPAPHRCDVDRLLVLTFTDAAAAEMKTRIVDAIRRRSESHPHDSRLREQMLLADAAQISTIHSFCAWVIRRWFHFADVDPMFTVLDAEEAALLRNETLDELFERRFSELESAGGMLGEDLLAGAAGQPQRAHSCSNSPFQKLIDAYGLGEDREIRSLVLRLYEFTTSLEDSDRWLADAVDALTVNSAEILNVLAAELRRELELQAPHCRLLAEQLLAGNPAGHDYARLIEAYDGALARWIKLMDESSSAAEALDRLQAAISSFSFERAPRAHDLSDPKKEAREYAKFVAVEVKNLFSSRVKERFGYFTSDQWLTGMKMVAPFVQTVVDLVRAFSLEYARRKKKLGVLDFSDLERVAFELIRDQDGRPSVVAAELRERFEHVLVDEFQDINPVQQAILKAVSRDNDSTRASNFFVVGDVKQSIYRFRLAEPELFLQRLAHLEQSTLENGAKPGAALFLQSNFRSRARILDAVNVLFAHLMDGKLGGIRYDDKAALRRGREIQEAPLPVEVHLLDRFTPPGSPIGSEILESDAAAAENGEIPTIERRYPDDDPPSHWDPIVREACLIGRRIRELIAESRQTGEGTNLRYGDIAVLLRATQSNAAPVAATLNAMGIPANAEVGGSLLSTREIREVLSALHVLDNVQQDIPLAAVLRSGIFGDCFTEDELVAIRLIDRAVPFQAAVRRYAESGEDNAIHSRLEAVLRRIEKYRQRASREPVARTIWSLLEDQGYMAQVCSLPRGAQRKANLLKLFDLARKFETHRRQGLHRFLRVLESLARDDQTLSLPPCGSQGQDVVRIMSIHHAKGMEFPVVFLAGLGSKFNLGDRNGRMIFERHSKIGLRALDTERMLEFPTAIHVLAAAEIERHTRDEELRVLYVAMTRAKQRLIMLGSTSHVSRLRTDPVRAVSKPSALRLCHARSFLDWLLPVLVHAANDKVDGMGGIATSEPIFCVRFHDAHEIETWTLSDSGTEAQPELLETASRLEPFRRIEPANAQVLKVVERVRSTYPWLSTTSVRATLAASQFQPHSDTTRGDTLPGRAIATAGLATTPAMQRGLVTHRVLQCLDFTRAVDPGTTRGELERLVLEGVLSSSERELVPEDAVSWFVTTPLAQAIRDAGTNYHREIRFVTAEPLVLVDPAICAADDDRVLVRGMIDGIVLRPDRCEIIDFKTDALSASQAVERAECYKPQMMLYARAVEKLWKRPVRRCTLVFLHPRCTVEVDHPVTVP